MLNRIHSLVPSLSGVLVSCGLLASCASSSDAPGAAAPMASATAAASGADSGSRGPDDILAAGQPAQIVSRNAVLDQGRFSELPGWSQDDLTLSWDSFLTSCRALAKKPMWAALCQRATTVRRTNEDIRSFYESEFALYRIGNPDLTKVGDITGYYEPIVAGSLVREGSFVVPVYGTPADLYNVDWKNIAPQLRRTTIFVMPHGKELVPVARAQSGSVRLDASRFTADARYRYWSVRVDNGQAVPYRTRAEIGALDKLDKLDAPVLAWVDDPLALYAMQTQGSGRVRLADGSILRLEFASQNGQPFKPLRLAVQPGRRVATRSLVVADAEPQHFQLADVDAETAARPSMATRSLRVAAQSGDVASPTRAAATPGTTATNARPPAVRGAAALNADPSYVFFQVGSAKAGSEGPVGALGVPLTPGRSIAVDPRTTPLGYPVYLSAGAGDNARTAPLQHLFMAQDTGGAIRGAVRADVFWGLGHDAEKEALQTPQRGQMWLMLPRAEAASLRRSQVATRSLSAKPVTPPAESDCLIPDESHCLDTN